MKFQVHTIDTNVEYLKSISWSQSQLIVQKWCW